MTDPVLVALATAVPKHRIRQAEAREGARRVFAGRARDFERLAPVYDNAGIDTRHACEPIDWYVEQHDWPERNGKFLDHAVPLIQEAAEAALAEAGLQPAEIDALVTVCSTGMATPSLDAMLMQRMAFRPETTRLPIFGLGCAGGVLGLDRAAMLARARPGAKVLLLVVELCSLTFRRRDLSKSNIIATALFADGAAAAVIGPPSAGRPGKAAIVAGGEHTWPDSLGVMGWSMETDGFGVLFSRDIPTLVRDEMRPVAETFLARNGLSVAEMDGMICHPGGAKVVEALETAFARPPGSLDAERAVLRSHGNMSAATVFFVLQRRLQEGRRGRQLVSALGPGFTAAFALLDM